MKCAYSAGVLDAFLDHNITFDYCIGVSAGSANSASYLAGQRGRNLRFYTDHIEDPNYFGVRSLLKNGDLFNLRYIYGPLTNSDGPDPVDYEALQANPAEFFIVATNAETGKPHYFAGSDMPKDDYRIIMASCAIPAVSRPVEIDGAYYFDGGISDSIPVQRALDDGCTKVVALLSKPHDFVKTPEGHKRMYSILCRRYPKAVECLNTRHIMYTECQQKLFDLEKEGRAFVFAPLNPPKLSTYTMDKQVNQQLYDMGFSDYEKYREAFERFLAED